MEKTLTIKGMTCSHCVMNIEKVLNDVCGVTSAKVDLKQGKAYLELSHEVDDITLSKPISALGYEVKRII